MLFSQLYKIMVSTATFVGFRGVDRPNRPLDPSLFEGYTTFCLGQPRLRKTVYIALPHLSKGIYRSTLVEFDSVNKFHPYAFREMTLNTCKY